MSERWGGWSFRAWETDEGRSGAHYPEQDGSQFSHLKIRLSCSCGYKKTPGL